MALQKSSQTNQMVIQFLFASPPDRCFKPLIYFPRSSRLNDAYTVLKLHSHDIRKRGAHVTLSTGVTESEIVLEEEANNDPDTFINQRRILLSDVIVKKPRKLFAEGRKWTSLDLGIAGVILSMHVLSLFAPFYFSWSALYVALSLYVITGLFGITLSYHRNLAHRSFNLPKWLEYSFAYCGVLSLQGDPISWVNTHRYHHVSTDTEGDPHSPTEGFWFSYMTWLLDETALKEKFGEGSKAKDLQKQSFYRILQRTYLLHSIALGLLLHSLGGFPFLVWGMGVRTVCVYHIAWIGASACHIWGQQPWNTGDSSRNNWFVSLLLFGEGWHNNHHAFQYSARHGFEWWQFDIAWYTVRLLQAIGLATDVKLPTEFQKRRFASKAATSLTHEVAT